MLADGTPEVRGEVIFPHGKTPTSKTEHPARTFPCGWQTKPSAFLKTTSLKKPDNPFLPFCHFMPFTAPFRPLRKNGPNTGKKPNKWELPRPDLKWADTFPSGRCRTTPFTVDWYPPWTTQSVSYSTRSTVLALLKTPL